jgi:hypothetical protein
MLLHLDRPMHVRRTCNHTAPILLEGQAPETMTKKPFTTRFDPDVLALAQQLAKAQRRSITAIIELALIEYAERHGHTGDEHQKEKD